MLLLGRVSERRIAERWVHSCAQELGLHLASPVALVPGATVDDVFQGVARALLPIRERLDLPWTDAWRALAGMTGQPSDTSEWSWPMIRAAFRPDRFADVAADWRPATRGVVLPIRFPARRSAEAAHTLGAAIMNFRDFFAFTDGLFVVMDAPSRCLSLVGRAQMRSVVEVIRLPHASARSQSLERR